MCCDISESLHFIFDKTNLFSQAAVFNDVFNRSLIKRLHWWSAPASLAPIKTPSEWVPWIFGNV